MKSFRKIRRSIRKIGESFLICLGLIFIPFLPRRCVVALADFLGDAILRHSRKLRNIGFANLDAVYGDSITQERKKYILRGSFRTFALLVLDLFWFTVFIERRLKKYVLFDPSIRHFTDNEPAVVMTAHFGNWEVLGQAFGLMGKPCTSLAMQLKNSFANRFLNWRREVNGQLTVDRDGAIRRIMEVLRKEKGRVAMLLDQNVLPEDGGQFVDFFGIPLPVSKAAETLAVRTGAKIVPVKCIADEKGFYTASAYPPVDTANASLSSGITQAVADTLEKIIREHPEKWLWAYKYWKYIPEEADKNKYPFYAQMYIKPGK